MFLSTKTCLTLPAHLLAWEKLSAAKNMKKLQVDVLLAVNNNLSGSPAAIQLQANQKSDA